MRIVSLQPSVTVTLAALGALDQVVACTKYCSAVCPEAADGTRAIVEDSWTANVEKILSLRPDLVITSVPYQLDSLAAILKAGVRLLALAPKSLADIYGDVRTLSRVVGQSAAGEKIAQELQDEVEFTYQQTAGLPRQRVYCEAWGKPIMASPRWVAEMVRASGGEIIGTPGAQISEEEVAEQNPEVILAAWPGAGDRVPLQYLLARKGWAQTSAAREHRVFCVADELFNTPAHTLTGGLRAIRWALHPSRYWKPVGIEGITAEKPGEQPPAHAASSATKVAAAVILQENQVLICQRGEKQLHPLQWEFPGGKVEAGESFQQALTRELQEELGIRAKIEHKIATADYRYGDGRAVEVHFFLVREFEGEMQNKVFRQIRWQERTSLDAETFLEADRSIVQRIAASATETLVKG